VGNLLVEFKNLTGINAIITTDDVLLSKAASWQGTGSYPGIDDWQIFEIPAGTKLYGGLPGQSEFYSVEKTLIDANYNRETFWESLQVIEHPQFGFRPKVGEYLVNSNIKVAVSKTLANPQHGVGGAWQIFVENFSESLTFVKEIPLQ
jgi:filamentous hemagglutinin